VNQHTTVLLADDHAMMRAGLKLLLESEPGVEVVGEAADGRSAVRMAEELQPNVIVMDINMPDLNGIEATRQIRAEGKGPKVIALTAYSPSRFSGEMLRAGASAFVLKSNAFQELGRALHSVLEDRVYLSPSVSDAMMADTTTRLSPEKSIFSTLSGREREVLQLLAEGKATKEIAAELRVSIKTAETHRRNLMEKLGTHSVAELTKYAIREGITSVEL
jgi:DNA-binding NarL/FixJ family response regulator